MFGQSVHAGPCGGGGTHGLLATADESTNASVDPTKRSGDNMMMVMMMMLSVGRTRAESICQKNFPKIPRASELFQLPNRQTSIEYLLKDYFCSFSTTVFFFLFFMLL